MFWVFIAGLIGGKKKLSDYIYETPIETILQSADMGVKEEFHDLFEGTVDAYI